MFWTSYFANKLADWKWRGQTYTPAANNFFGLLTTSKGPRGNSTAYALNDTISLTANDGKTHAYKCTTAGTSAAAQSTLYPGAANEAITDGTAVFTEMTSLLRAGLGSGVVEGSWTNYARATVAASLAAISGTQGAGTTVASTGTGVPTVSNNATITFGTTPGSGPSYVWAVAEFDAVSGGNMLSVSPLAAGQTKTVNSGDPAPTVAAGQLQLSVDA